MDEYFLRKVVFMRLDVGKVEKKERSQQERDRLRLEKMQNKLSLWIRKPLPGEVARWMAPVGIALDISGIGNLTDEKIDDIRKVLRDQGFPRKGLLFGVILLPRPVVKKIKRVRRDGWGRLKIDEAILSIYRIPKEGEDGRWISPTDIGMILSLPASEVGSVMKKLGFSCKRVRDGMVYRVVVLQPSGDVVVGEKTKARYFRKRAAAASTLTEVHHAIVEHFRRPIDGESFELLTANDLRLEIGCGTIGKIKSILRNGAFEYTKNPTSVITYKVVKIK